MAIHRLKVDHLLWYDLCQGKKTFEYRLNDRDFKLGDSLMLFKYDTHNKEYMDDFMSPLSKRVTYILYGGMFGIPKDYCIMVIK